MSQTTLPEWDLTDLFPSVESKKFRDAMKQLQSDADTFAKKRKKIESENYTAKELLAMLKKFEQIEIQMLHLYAFCHLQYDVNTKDAKVKGMLDKMKGLVTNVSSEIEFFMQGMKKMSKGHYKKMVSAKELAPYKHFLITVKLYEPYTLSEKEERLLTLKSLHASQSWGQFHTELSGGLDFGEMKVDGKMTQMTPSKLSAIVSSSTKRNQREEAYILGRKPFKDNGHLFAFAYNAVVSDYEQDSRLIRGFSRGLSRAALGEEVTEKNITSMIEVMEDHVPVYQAFYKWKKKLLGYKDLYNYDLRAPVSKKRPQIPFAKAKKLVLECFADFDQEFATLAEQFFTNKWIDAREGANKYAGAYSYSMEKHPYILLNFQPTFHEVFTMAHELGHGVHALLSRKQQPFLMRDTSKVIAESASQFSELLLLDKLTKEYEDKELVRDLLITHIDDLLYCLSSSMTVTLFELESHEMVQQGGLSQEALCELWEKVHKKLNGNVVKRTEVDPYGWARIPHIFQSPYYYFTYPMSLLVVLALYEQYQEKGDAFVPQFKAFLEAGGSMAPDELMKETVGLQFGTKRFYKLGFRVVEDMIARVMKM